MTDNVRFNTFLTPRGKRLEYLISVPATFEAGGTYPALLALPPGEQTRDLAMDAPILKQIIQRHCD